MNVHEQVRITKNRNCRVTVQEDKVIGDTGGKVSFKLSEAQCDRDEGLSGLGCGGGSRRGGWHCIASRATTALSSIE